MIYSFEDFSFDPEMGLTRSGTPVPLEPLALELLNYLVRNKGRIISRDELNAQLWDGRIVSDAALSTQIRAVRRALEDDRNQQRFIKTYPRRGFSFVAPVEPIDAVQPPAAQPAAPNRRKLLAIAGAVVLALLVGLVAISGDRLAIWRTSNPERGLSIAVLPFDNLSGDASQDYLADAFTEDLITDLSRIRDAFVISRSTTFTYRGKERDAAQVAEELGVRYVLEGSLRVDGDEVRINAQLIDGQTNSHLWSDRFNRPLSTLFNVQDNVTGRIASVLRAELRIAEDERQDPEVTQDAWDHALRGTVMLYNHQSISDYQQAYTLLKKAVVLDPSISSAWTGLSFVHYVASVTQIPGVSQPDSAELSLEAARKAVEADPMNAEPYWLVGAGLARIGQPEKGMSACEAAIKLNPNMDCGHVCAGLVHMANDGPEQAVPYFQTALRLNPMFRPFTKEKYLGLAHIQSGDNAAAIAALNRALAKAPNDDIANLALVAALALDDRVPEAPALKHDRRGPAPARDYGGWKKILSQKGTRHGDSTLAG
jgi:TolB-like protein/DNA-binding winged helix-turn-helix (wHTH) protein/Tfp pilus assembly protein PilF